MKETLENNTHKRYNILTDEWVLVSPHRTKRPWQGQEEKTIEKTVIEHDPSCYLCAGNKRSNGITNPDYTDTFVFENDFAALKSDSETFEINNGLLKASSEKGIGKVICFSPNHSKSLAEMSVQEIEKVITVWQSEYSNLGKLDFINYVQIFENKGAVMGCSNSHPHGQVWAQSSIPNEVQKRNLTQTAHFQKHRSSLLSDYIEQELKLNERILFENDHMVVLVPFWAVWPYETMIVPKKQQAHIGLLTTSQKIDYAEAIKKLTACYDQLFNCAFPYSSGIHQAPTDGNEHNHWHWHMSFYPPLLRSASVKKFMVGYEMFAMPQRDITAEMAAATLKNLMR
ncbi:MAG: UDP-glucose--hexose-1-phosphate uridylyltransferase [Polaribacter sp.]|nr:UDP-glucose--hexose-1-phosphate uridylyltransferase [Polaribacter sp.]